MNLRLAVLLLLPVALSGCQDLHKVEVAITNEGAFAADLNVTVIGNGVERTRTYRLEPGGAWLEDWLLPADAYTLRFDDGQHPVRTDLLDSCRTEALVVRHDGVRYTVLQMARDSSRYC